MLISFRALCIERPAPAKAEERILIWCFQSDAQIHLHMWERESRGKGLGAVLFCLSALEFIKRFELKTRYCQPKADNSMPNRMLRRIGFTELQQFDYRFLLFVSSQPFTLLNCKKEAISCQLVDN
jgi:hypothetical protein